MTDQYTNANQPNHKTVIPTPTVTELAVFWNDEYERQTKKLEEKFDPSRALPECRVSWTDLTWNFPNLNLPLFLEEHGTEFIAARKRDARKRKLNV